MFVDFIRVHTYTDKLNMHVGNTFLGRRKSPPHLCQVNEFNYIEYWL